MSEKEFENAYTKLWKKIDAFSPELKEIYFANWDETGRPKDVNTENRAIIAILNKNTEAGYVGFKFDMNTLFDKEAFTEKQLATYYNVYVAGARHLADKLIEGKPPASKVKP
jgi:hypothetical protein